MSYTPTPEEVQAVADNIVTRKSAKTLADDCLTAYTSADGTMNAAQTMVTSLINSGETDPTILAPKIQQLIDATAVRIAAVSAYQAAEAARSVAQAAVDDSIGALVTAGLPRPPGP